MLRAIKNSGFPLPGLIRHVTFVKWLLGRVRSKIPLLETSLLDTSNQGSTNRAHYWSDAGNVGAPL
jgi:hypothetical protein